MKRAIQFFLRYPVVTLVVALLAVAVGVNALLNMPRMEDPSITIRTGLVMAAFPGATSEQVEQQVTRPIETHLFKFPEIRKSKTYATSRPGLVIINVELEDNVKEADVFWNKLRAELALAKASELPQGVMGPIVDSDFGETVAMLIAIHGDRYNYRELRDYADKVKDELRSIREVGRLVTYGEQEEQIWVTGNLGRLSQYSTDPARIMGALSQRNTIAPSGNLETQTSKIPFQVPGLFHTEDQLRQLMVDVTPTGQPVYLGDLAQIERHTQDPDNLVRYDGHPCLLVSVEMQKGNNIVQMGEKVTQAMDRLQKRLPSDLKLDYIANQPAVVDSRMHHLGVEFLLAIGAVILVAIVLLPMRVAVIAALAIPITMLGTLGIMNATGIELHQVSIAALIVVLGIVVDDAIVIADNYLECLDHGQPRLRAAWKSAAEVFVPVLTATLTIIASFLPLLILQGSVGEFILALPITVAIALSVSFLVAIFITPWLCRTFITQGIKTTTEAKPAKHFNLLDWIQNHYGNLISWLMSRKKLTLLFGGISIAVGALLYTLVPQQFFPSAERNQFVIDLWMPEGTKIAATQGVLQRIEGHLRTLPQVDHFATFVGQSAPRFYYNVNPQQPDAAYGQLVVNTKNAKQTEPLVQQLQRDLKRVAPEGIAIVKELQQGDSMEAPLEIRVIGENAADVRTAGRQVEDLLRGLPGSQFVHTDHFNDSPMVGVDINTEWANRLGLTHAGIAQTLAGGLEGAPTGVFWEGHHAIPVLLRMDTQHRNSFGAISATPLTSPATQGSLPLAAVASLKPEWQPSRLVRRNGLPTLTVQSFVKPGCYASTLQAAVEKQLPKLSLPKGVRVTFGGEVENQQETFPRMVLALGISLIAIFLVLLVQFRNLKEPLVIMASIPLSVFGAMLGLLVTRNPFGFTAFMGMISLCGIVVRNAIILVDYIKERRREGASISAAATEAGARRLRPIFLTTMAAAVGVLPMILSGSKLWSPLASVIALGLVFSMMFTLLLIPVLYVVVMERKAKTKAFRAATAGMLILGFASINGHSAEPLSLQRCVDRALQQNAAVKIAQAKVEEQRHKVHAAQTDYLPQLTGSLDWSHSTTTGLVNIPAGSFGSLAGGAFPSQNLTLDQGSHNLSLANITLGQPLTQLFKVRQGDVAAQKDLQAAEAELAKISSEVRLGVHQAYFGLLIARQQQVASAAEMATVEATMEDSRSAVKAGQALKVLNLGAGASLLQARQKCQVAKHQEADCLGELKDLIGAGSDEAITLHDENLPLPAIPSLDSVIARVDQHNADLRSARALHEKSLAGIRAAQWDYVPEVSAYVRYTNQSGVPFLKNNFATAGLQVSWNLFDWGKRNHVIHQRAAESLQAKENVRRLESRVRLDAEKGYRKLEDALALVDAANQAVLYQAETLRIAKDQREAGLIPPAKLCEATAADAKARLEALQAKLNACLAMVDLERLSGK